MAWFDELKYSFQKGDSMVRKLIFINVGVWIFFNLSILASYLINGSNTAGETFVNWFLLPSKLSELIYRPWTLITYMFAHLSFWHILANMLYLYFLGNIFRDFLGNRKLLLVYFWGGISGGLLYLIGMNLIPVLSTTYNHNLLGASAGVLAVIVAIATLIPDYSIRLFIFDIKLKYIALASFLISVFGISGINPGGNLAHVGGAIFGFFYIRQIRHYSFIDRWSESAQRIVNKVFRKKKDERKIVSSYTVYMKTESKRKPNQEEVDAILDKINTSGYNSLTQEEKETLFKASNNNP